MGLHGGGEESVTSGSSGWGSLPPMSSSSAEWGSSGNTATLNSSANHWPNNNSRQNAICDQTLSTSPKPSSSWAQAAGKGLNNGPIGPNHDLSVFGNNDNSTKRQTNSDLQQLSNDKDTVLINDNWGITVINQDSPWKLPPSPQSSPKECNSGSQWKSSTKGTEIWENTVRRKGPTPTPTSMSSSSSSWGHHTHTHTPSTHIGGTWGEEEDSSNHWTGVPQVNNNNNNPNNNNNNINPNNNNINPNNNNINPNNNNNNINNNNNPNNNANNWTNNGSNNSNNGNNGNNNSNMQWNHNIDKVETNSRHSSEGRENRPKTNHNSNWSEFGVTNEQNDSNGPDSSWSEPKSDQSFGTWAPESTHKKDPNSSGWDKDSSDSHGGNFDDGTAVWGNPVRQGKVSHWKEQSQTAKQQQQQQQQHHHQQQQQPMNPQNSNPNGNNLSGISAMIPSSPGMIRLPAGAPISGKNGDSWSKPSPPIQTNRGNSWSETSTRDSPSNNSVSLWGDSDNKNSSVRTPNTPNWAESSNSSPLAYWAAKPKATNNPNANWSDGQIDTSSWGGPKQGKPLSRDIIWASKQFRILTEMGFKKEDIENSLRNSSMKLEEAIIELKNSSTRDSNAMDLDGLQRLKGSGMGSSNTPSLLSNTSGIANSSLSSINRNPLGSILPPPPPHQSTAQTQSFTQANQVQSALGSNPNGSRIGGSAQSNQPNAAQLRLLVQQIQLAVQAGHLNAQILNQPLAPPTLHLLYQLLQQIRILHQLQISANQHLSKTGPTNAGGVPAIQSSINVQITQTKQRILNFQNQIAAQQAIFLKEQQQSQHIVTQTPNSMNSGANTSTPLISQQTANNDFFKSPQQDNTLVINNDRELGPQSLSRFQTTWKQGFTKDDMKVNNIITNDFSRAPGPMPKHNGLTRNDVSNWTAFGQTDELGGWPSDMTVNSLSGATLPKHNDLKDISNSLSNAIPDAYNLNDLVPEFEPGKPWKGNSSLKSIEDDPTITPGSVNRSPLSINTIKDPLFNWPSKLSPGTPNTNADSLLSLSSSTWAFTPPSNSHIYNTVDNNKTKNNLKSPSNWAEPQLNSCTDNLWSGGSVSKTRGPPPGLTPQIKSPATTLSNSGAVNQTVSSAHTLWNSDNRHNGSEFLLLRNLTPQIDGSTLKTLCLQHGPLQLFHLFLNHGIALTRYSTREEAIKAQSALNNCVLGNTSILADIPQEAEVQQYLQLIQGGGQQIASNPLNWSQNGQNNSSSNGVNQSSSLYRNANSSLQFAGNSTSNPSKMESSTTSPGWNTSSIGMWGFANSGNNLWSAPSAQDRSTPSSIQSLLPGDLLGSETN
ncbi:protein Gawky-like [Oppia nitens]|uniref:protein Gawky-like n=1 Tax=Oppia nitens TaxID=1686743 RepID=UPI0023DBFAE2|nr:protein Gawky-like [Oppia nitens]XP_054155071.1 protein Gawky-like [Oppia nitens]